MVFFLLMILFNSGDKIGIIGFEKDILFVSFLKFFRIGCI